MIILEENFQWHLEAFESELFIYNLNVNSYQFYRQIFCAHTEKSSQLKFRQKHLHKLHEKHT